MSVLAEMLIWPRDSLATVMQRSTRYVITTDTAKLSLNQMLETANVRMLRARRSFSFPRNVAFVKLVPDLSGHRMQPVSFVMSGGTPRACKAVVGLVHMID
jgi:hypothetical protein